jgi:hypothetical protein
VTPRFRIFARLWGVAAVAHVVGNWAQPDLPHPVGWVNLAVGLVAIAVILFPQRLVLLVLCALVPVSVVLEMPFLGNHWLVAGLASLAILVTGARQPQAFAGARLVLLVFYSFAAFAKLNSGFFDPTASCAVFYTNQWLGSYGLPAIVPQSVGAELAIIGTVLVEASVPILLLSRRTRYTGVVVGTAFHTLISFDLDQHFFDFTAVLLPLFFLFLPDRAVEEIAGSFGRLPQWTRSTVRIVFASVAAWLVLVSVFPLVPLTAPMVLTWPFFLWVPFSAWWVWRLVRARAPGQRFSWRAGPALAVVAITILNGLTPYTEVKTAYSFNMYANLLTAAGESNHFVVRDTLRLRHDYSPLVEVLESNDPGLLAYREQGYLIAMPELRRYLAGRPDTSLVYEVEGQRHEVARAGDDPLLSDPGPWWWGYLPLRAVDRQSPPRCQDVWLGAL